MRQSQVSQDAQMAGSKSNDAFTLISFAVCLTAVQGAWFIRLRISAGAFPWMNAQMLVACYGAMILLS